MKVKTFYALTMQDALRSIKEELGPDAIILSSKEVREGDRLLRVCNRPVLEVMAACEQDTQREVQTLRAGVRDSMPRQTSGEPAAQVPAPRQTSGEPAAQVPALKNFQSTLHAVLKSAVVAPAQADFAEPVSLPSAPPAQVKWRRTRLQHLRTELSELSRALGASLSPDARSMKTRLPPVLARLCRSFIRQGMRPSAAEALMQDLRERVESRGALDEGAVTEALRREIGRRVHVGGYLIGRRGRRAIGLILGPSGAGKTSVVSKLAAHYRLEQQQSVAVVTFDSCRDVSVEQLRRYARSLGVPFASARSPRQLHEGLRRYSRANLVLIDMPGVGPEDVSSAGELHRFLHEGSEMATHVVLPASARERDLRAIVDRVKMLPSLRILFTKLDETAGFGTIFDLAQQTGVPLSYWGVGQRVPEDIEAATPDRLTEFLMAQRYVAVRGSVRGTPVMSAPVYEPEAVGSVSDYSEG